MNIGDVTPGNLVELVDDEPEVPGPNEYYFGSLFPAGTIMTVLAQSEDLPTKVAVDGRRAYVEFDTPVTVL